MLPQQKDRRPLPQKRPYPTPLRKGITTKDIISKLVRISKYGGLEDSAFSPTLLSATRPSTKLRTKELLKKARSLPERELILPIALVP